MSKASRTPENIIFVCEGSKCKKRGGKTMAKALKDYCKMVGKDQMEVIKTECTGRCKLAPVLCVQPANKWLFEYNEYDLDKVFKVIEK